jgi:hypothetical protein
MLAKGMGARQFATRSALYSAAKELISPDVVPGTPSASDAPGAPAVDPPIAAGQVGVGVGVGAGAGAVKVAGALLKLCSLVLLDAELMPDEEPVADVELLVAVDGTAAAVEPVAAELVLPVDAATVFAVNRSVETDAGDLSVPELEIVTLAACETSGVPDDPAPWTMITAATSAVATRTAFFNVCTPIQRLHCPPN